MEEQEQVIQDDSQDQEQLPVDASDDDLTLEELDKVNDDDFEKYHKSEISAKEIRDKYNLKQEDTISEDNDTQDQQSDDDEEDEQSNTEDYEKIWKEISSPFKANGKMYQPQSSKDVIALMQKGVNYTQKMQQIAPFRKVAQTLRDNNIDENELNFLIDLHKGDKKAISSLLKKTNYDYNDYNPDSEEQYTPHNNMASDASVEMSEIIDDIAPNKEKIADIIYNKWDKASQKAFTQKPELLRLLNEEINLGRFETIQNQVEQYKMFGRAGDLPDIQLYANLAAAYEAAEKEFLQQKQQNSYQQQMKQSDASSKRAAAPSGRTNVKAKGSTLSPNDILSMSEDDFNKIDLNKLLAKG